jgi:BON domain-containing protein
MKNWKRATQSLLLGGLLAAAPALALGKPKATQGWANPAPREAYVKGQVRHELLMLPYYSVFDNLEYGLNGTRVELLGQVTRPTLKSDAENVVQRIEGVEGVTNKIEVLPLSSYDDRIRFAVYRAVFRRGSLYRYALGANPSIHIIVDNGNVTLAGVVGNQMDKNIAGLEANGVPGVFSVTNNLRVEG